MQHVLYLADAALVSTIVACDGIRDRRVFDRAQPDDYAVLERLRANRRLPACLVVDLADETVETIALAAKQRRDRALLAQRALSQRHPETPFRFACLTTGARALLAAVSRPEALSRWLAALDALELPLTGVHSSTLLSASWAAVSASRSTPCLIATSLPSGALRLTGIDENVPVFSRVAAIGLRLNVHAWAHAVAQEVQRTAQYLQESGRWAVGPGAIETIVLAHPQAKADLESSLGAAEAPPFRVVGVDEVGRALGLSSATCLGSADELIATMLARDHAPNQYAPPRALRHALFRRSRRVMGALSATTALAGLAIGAWNISQAGHFNDSERAASMRIVSLSAERSALASTSPALPASAAFLEQLSDVHTGVLGLYSEPHTLLLPVSHVLAQYPEVRLTQLAWQVSDDLHFSPSLPQPPSDAPGSLRSPPVLRAPRASARPDAARLPTGRLAVAVLEGVMPPLGGDVAASLQRMAALAAAISALPGVQAELLDRPLDDTSSARIQGRFAAGVMAHPRDRFTLRVTWRALAPA